MRVGSSEGTSSTVAPAAVDGDSSRYERTPSSLRATTMTQSAVWPSMTKGFSPVSTHCAALRRARVRTVASGSPWPCSPRAMVPRRVPAARSASSSVAPRARAASVAATAEEKYGPGSGMRPICSKHDARLEQAGAGAAVLGGDEEAGPAEVDERRPQRGRDAGVVVGQLAQQLRAALALERASRATSWSASCSSS